MNEGRSVDQLQPFSFVLFFVQVGHVMSAKAVAVTPVSGSFATRTTCKFGEECWNTRPEHRARCLCTLFARAWLLTQSNQSMSRRQPKEIPQLKGEANNVTQITVCQIHQRAKRCKCLALLHTGTHTHAHTSYAARWHFQPHFDCNDAPYNKETSKISAPCRLHVAPFQRTCTC